MKIVILDAATLGEDCPLTMFDSLGEVEIYDMTSQEESAERIVGAEVVVLNKVKLNRENLEGAKKLKLVCVTATGFDNIDTAYCRERGIAVCNVKAYSTSSVAQVTAAMVLSLVNHLSVFDTYTKSGAYTQSGLHNYLKPVYHEMDAMTWGIVGLGHIGKKVAAIARTLGCEVIAYKRTPEIGERCVDIDTLCRESDIITIHTPLNPGTERLIDSRRIGLMKDGVILVNAARGAVTDEAAVAEGVLSGKIGGYGTDVYTVEPLQEESPIWKLRESDRVILTPHMAWGAYESRIRCMEEVAENIAAFIRGEKRNRLV